MIVYRKGIHIEPVEGQYLGGGTPLTGKIKPMFIDYIQQMLDEVDALPLGKELITEICQSGKTVTIYKADAAYEASGPTTMKAVLNITSDINKMVKSYRPIESKMLKAMARPVANTFLAAAPQGVRGKNPALLGAQRGAALAGAPAQFEPTKETIYSSELTKILDRASVSLTRKQIATMIGLDEAGLQALEEGGPMDNNVHARIGMVLYEFLTPGPGIDTVIRFAPIADIPDAMSMGHELIHSWRMMKGLRLFQSGWEEEAMTTGFPPFANFKFTENKLRIQAKMEVRNSYNNPVTNSLFMQNSYAHGCGISNSLGQS